MTAIAGVLLTLAIASIAVSGVGLLAVRDGRDRIHYAGPATTLAPLLVAGALAAAGRGGWPLVSKAVLLALVMGGASAVVSHALLAARTPGPGRR